MNDGKTDRSERVSTAVHSLIIGSVDRFISQPDLAEIALATGTTSLPADIISKVGVIEGKKSYRDGLLIQLAFGLVSDTQMDHTQRQTGGRWAAGAVGKGFAERHIPAVRDAYQNIGKNSVNLARGNEPDFDDLLRWMNGTTISDRQTLFDYVTARVAATSRPVLAMPVLRPAALTFDKLARLLDELLAVQSGGAHEQFAVAAFLEALLHESGLGGYAGGLRVETKNINASDASAGTAADVQIMRANKIEEVFEVSANSWRTKVSQAVSAAVGADQPRAHIIAAADGDDRDLAALAGLAREVTVADVRSFLRVMAAVLRRPARERALQRFYELMDGRQPDTELTNGYVRLLSRLQLTDEAPLDVVRDSQA
jgi:Phage-related tail protein